MLHLKLFESKKPRSKLHNLKRAWDGTLQGRAFRKKFKHWAASHTGSKITLQASSEDHYPNVVQAATTINRHSSMHAARSMHFHCMNVRLEVHAQYTECMHVRCCLACTHDAVCCRLCKLFICLSCRLLQNVPGCIQQGQQLAQGTCSMHASG